METTPGFFIAIFVGAVSILIPAVPPFIFIVLGPASFPSGSCTPLQFAPELPLP